MRWIFPARLPDIRDFRLPVHDGDTLWLTVDKGHRDAKVMDNRLKGLYAPEVGHPGGAETHAQVLAWLATHGALVEDTFRPWPLAVEHFKTRGANDVQTLNRWVAMVWAGDPDDVRAGKPLPCLNTDIALWLHMEHPEWGGGTGGR
jgi:hypothetical protein